MTIPYAYSVFLAAIGAALGIAPGAGPAYLAPKVAADLSKRPATGAAYWQGVPEIEIPLLAQMMANPRPAAARTAKIKVQVVHDGRYAAYRLRWNDSDRSEAGRLAEFSDAVALEFPVLDNANPPPVFMGARGNPVHLFHWRAQYQRDEESGKPDMKELYPNLQADAYPNEFADRGRLKPATEGQTETFSPAKAAGNPQAYPKKAVDELLAEGFGTSAQIPGGNAVAHGDWKAGEWVVVISRALECRDGSKLEAGKGSAFGVAVWQGGAEEVGSRKSLSMAWTPFTLAEK